MGTRLHIEHEVGMAIRNADASGKTITEGSRALECFTDRIEAVKRFNLYLNQEPAQGTFLFFHGVGGNGKSLLLRFLRKHCCRLSSDWESLEDIGHTSELTAYADKDVKLVPSAWLDFGMPPNGENRPQEAFPALLMLRRALSGDQLRFPLYDFACIWYLHKTKRLNPVRLASLFPTEELGLLSAVCDVISKTAFGTLASAVISVFSKHFKEQATVYWQSRKLEAEDLKRIQDLDVEFDLMDELPSYFAADLNASMQLETAPKRVVLFFDTHESFRGLDRGLGDDYFYRQEQWFRCLLNALQPEKGIIVVCAGRELPRWSRAKKHPIPDGKVEYRLIGNLSEESAQEYLRRVNIEDAAKRKLVCAYAEVEPGQVHPLFLGLCADIILEASERKIELAPDEFAKSPMAIDTGAKLVDRLLRSVDEETGDAVRAVSACRAFDRDIYFKLARDLHFNDTDHAFRKLTRFSFVSQVEGGGTRLYRIHDLLRRLFHESNEDFERLANEFLEGYYRQLTGPAATAEAIYHASRLDWRRGVREWVKVFDSALWSSDYPLCRALRAVRGVLGVKGHLESGMLARCEADFCKCWALHVESNHEYREAVRCFDRAQRDGDSIELQKSKAQLFLNFGELQATRNQLAECAKSYQKVIDICELALRIAKNDVELCNYKAEAQLGFGDLNIWASRSERAIESYSAAIEICDQILQQEQKHPLGDSLRVTMVDVLNNKAYGLSGIGDVASSLFRHEEAIWNYHRAESCYDEALQRLAADPVVQNDKAYNLVSIAESEVALTRYESALENCKNAVTLYDDVLKRAPEDIIYHSNKSRALRTAGISLAHLFRYDEALKWYGEALDSCTEALRKAPADTWALCNKGLVLLSIGEMHAETGKYSEALRSFTQSLDAFESLLAESPDDAEALAGKGRALFNRGEVLGKTVQREAAVEEYQQSVVSFDRALEDAAEDAEARKDKARALQRLGELYLVLDRRQDALDALNDALKEYSRSLDISPQHGPVRSARDRLAAFLSKLCASSE
jgi:tetratricopeptide (TPR) repeat protein